MAPLQEKQQRYSPLVLQTRLGCCEPKTFGRHPPQTREFLPSPQETAWPQVRDLHDCRTSIGRNHALGRLNKTNGDFRVRLQLSEVGRERFLEDWLNQKPSFTPGRVHRRHNSNITGERQRRRSVLRADVGRRLLQAASLQLPKCHRAARRGAYAGDTGKQHGDENRHKTRGPHRHHSLRS